MTLYAKNLNEKLAAQEVEKTVQRSEKNRVTDEIAQFNKQVEAISVSSVELEAAQNKAEQMEMMIRIFENGFAPKEEEIRALKKNLVGIQKQLLYYKDSAAAKDKISKVLSEESKRKGEDIAHLRRELDKKEYEIRSLKSKRQAQPNGSSLTPRRGSTTNESTLRRRIEEAEQDYTQLKNVNQCLRDKNIGHEDAIKTLKRQLDLKELESKQLETQMSRLTKHASDSLFRERR